MRPRWSLLIALAAALALAGCLGALGDDADATPTAQDAPTGEDPNGSPAPSTDERAPLSFALDEPFQETLWQNGSYQPHEHCNTGGCITGDTYRELPLDGLPAQVPVTVEATLTYDTQDASLFAYPMSLSLNPEGATVYSYQEEIDTGEHSLEATLLADTGDPVLEVASWWPSANTEGTYTLKAALSADPTTLPEGAPIALDLEPGDTIYATPDTGSATIDLRDADDEPLAQVRIEDDATPITIPEEARPGEHVLIPQGGGVLLEANATDASLRPLPVTRTLGDAHEVQAGEPLEFTFEAPGNLITVGVYATDQGDHGASATRGTVSLTGPEGPIIEDESFGCTICITNGFYAIMLAAPGDSLVPGTYEVAYDAGIEEGYAVGGVVTTYER